MILRAAGPNATRLRPPTRLRAGFTLLEILLATLIAVLLLAALYTALNVTLRQTQSGRDAVEAEDLSRGVFNKIAGDLNGTLTPLPPVYGANSGASGSATSSSSTGTTAGSSSTDPTASAAPAAAAPSTTTPATGTTDPTMPAATDTATATATPLVQGGVVGQEQMLILFLGKTPEAFGRYGENSQQVRSDQRQVVYKFVSGRGLFRAERPWVTADTLSMDLDPDAPDSVLLAEEATDVLFEYSDGTSWASTWDGTVPGPDGVAPLGPPRAVRLTLTLSVPSGNGEPLTRQISQIMVVRAAPGTYTPPLLAAPTDGATDSSTGGTTGSSTPSTGSSTPAAGGSTPSAGSSSPSSSSGGGAAAPAPSGGGSMGGGRTGGGK